MPWDCTMVCVHRCSNPFTFQTTGLLAKTGKLQKTHTFQPPMGMPIGLHQLTLRHGYRNPLQPLQQLRIHSNTAKELMLKQNFSLPNFNRNMVQRCNKQWLTLPHTLSVSESLAQPPQSCQHKKGELLNTDNRCRHADFGDSKPDLLRLWPHS